jgi:hypothetical protein
MGADTMGEELKGREGITVASAGHLADIWRALAERGIIVPEGVIATGH